MSTPDTSSNDAPRGTGGTGGTGGTVVVIATVTVRPGRLDDALDVVRANVPTVHEEDGCLTYAVHAAHEPDRIVFVERWSSADALAAHAASEHMAATNGRMADLVEGPAELVRATSVPAGTAAQGVF